MFQQNIMQETLGKHALIKLAWKEWFTPFDKLKLVMIITDLFTYWKMRKQAVTCMHVLVFQAEASSFNTYSSILKTNHTKEQLKTKQF